MDRTLVWIPRVASLMVISIIVSTHEQTNDDVGTRQHLTVFEDLPWIVITLKNVNRLVKNDKAFDSIMSLLIRNSRSNSQLGEEYEGVKTEFKRAIEKSLEMFSVSPAIEQNKAFTKTKPQEQNLNDYLYITIYQQVLFKIEMEGRNRVVVRRFITNSVKIERLIKSPTAMNTYYLTHTKLLRYPDIYNTAMNNIFDKMDYAASMVLLSQPSVNALKELTTTLANDVKRTLVVGCEMANITNSKNVTVLAEKRNNLVIIHRRTEHRIVIKNEKCKEVSKPILTAP